tara:strand:+ start:422 stop:664 length:243 start_codon:yes stop_codon:yes gene_type:complete
MNKLQIKLERLELMLVEDGCNKGNIVLQTVIDMQKEAINYTSCCKSDSEQLLAVAKYVYWNYDDSSSKKPEDYLKDFSSL